MPNETHQQVYELRQYTLHPNRRDDLIEVFDKYFIEGQNDAGMTVGGQFRDLDHPDRFVWLRSFPDLEQRTSSLQSFYGGSVWAAHKDVANATMIDSDDVLLLQPFSEDEHPFAGMKIALPAVGSTTIPSSLISVEVYHFSEAVDDEISDFFAKEVEPLLAEAGSQSVALLKTHPGPNGFPALPLREGEQVIVRVAKFDDEEEYAAYRERLGTDDRWKQVEGELEMRLGKSTQRLRLQPTARSQLR